MTNLEDIKVLTMWQLKEILAHNDNYKGCCEKWGLMERATWLYKDQKGLQNLVCGTEDQNGGVWRRIRVRSAWAHPLTVSCWHVATR